jgi:hypothetical protein
MIHERSPCAARQTKIAIRNTMAATKLTPTVRFQ